MTGKELAEALLRLPEEQQQLPATYWFQSASGNSQMLLTVDNIEVSHMNMYVSTQGDRQGDVLVLH
jgi:hypothetical protein